MSNFPCHVYFLQEYGIKGFPTIKVFVPGKPPVDYQGAREAKPIAEFALKQVIHHIEITFSICYEEINSN